VPPLQGGKFKKCKKKSNFENFLIFFLEKFFKNGFFKSIEMVLKTLLEGLFHEPGLFPKNL